MQKHYDPREASRYLQEVLGIRITPGTLNTWRSQGRGPQYKKIASKVYYEQSALDAFATGKPVKTIDSIDIVKR